MHQLKIGNCYITTTQLQAANAESIRLGFGQNLDLPPELPELKFPITRAFRHTSSDGELENIRLMIFFSLDTDNGSDGHVLILDVTRDWLVTIRDQTFDDELDMARNGDCPSFGELLTIDGCCDWCGPQTPGG